MPGGKFHNDDGGWDLESQSEQGAFAWTLRIITHRRCHWQSDRCMCENSLYFTFGLHCVQSPAPITINRHPIPPTQWEAPQNTVLSVGDDPTTPHVASFLHIKHPARPQKGPLILPTSAPDFRRCVAHLDLA